MTVIEYHDLLFKKDNGRLQKTSWAVSFANQKQES